MRAYANRLRSVLGACWHLSANVAKAQVKHPGRVVGSSRVGDRLLLSPVPGWRWPWRACDFLGLSGVESRYARARCE